MVKIAAMDAKKLYDPKLIADNSRLLYETIRKYNIKALQKNPDLAKEAGTVFHRLKELIEQYKNLPQQHKNPKMDGLFKRYGADCTNIEKKLSQFVQYPQEEPKKPAPQTPLPHKPEEKKFPDLGKVAENIKNIETAIEDKGGIVPSFYIISANEKVIPPSINPYKDFQGFSKEFSIKNAGDWILVRNPEGSEYHFKTPMSLKDFESYLKEHPQEAKAITAALETKAAKEKQPAEASIDQLVQAEIDKRGDKKPFYKFKLVENQITDLNPVEDPLNLTKTILLPGDHIAYDPAGTGKYTKSNIKFDIDAAVKRYSEKINPPKSSQQEAKQQDKPKEQLKKPFGAGISEKDLKEAEKSVRQASQERINEDKAARDNPFNANRPK